MISISRTVEHNGQVFGFTKTAWDRLLRALDRGAELGDPTDHAGRLLDGPTGAEACRWEELADPMQRWMERGGNDGGN